MTLNHAELAAVVSGLERRVVGARIQKIYQYADHTLLLALYGQNVDAWLVLCCEPGLAHIGLTHHRPASEPTPPRFCAAARKHLENGTIIETAAVPGDRVVTVTVEHADGVRTLVGELFGRNGNLAILDAEGVVLDAIRPAGGERPMRPGDSYREPPRSRPIGSASIRDFGPGSLPEAVARFYADQAVKTRFEQRRQEILRGLRRDLKKTNELLLKVRRELDELPDPEELRRDAEHVAGNVPQIPRGASRVELDDWYGGPKRVIALDPALSAAKNIAALFHRAARTQRKSDALVERLPSVEKRAVDLAAWLHEAEDAADVATLDDLASRSAAGATGRARLSKIPGTGKAQAAPSGPRRYFAADGAEILVGRDAKENDELTFRVARGNDWWLHVSGQSGSHVVVKTPENKGLSSETLLDAATLAVMGSKLARQRSGEVLYTQRKYVRKPKGAPPGRVTAEQTRTIFVRVEEERLERLSRSRQPE